MRNNLKNNLNKDIEQLIKSDFHSVKSKIDKNEGVILNMEKEKNSKKIIWLSTVGASLAAAVFVFTFMNTGTLTTVTLDVNPSIEFKIKNGVIKEVESINEDATKIINDLNLINKDLNEGTKLLLEELVLEGYISNMDNSVLISVDNSKESTKVQSDLEMYINEYLLTKNIEASVISQEVISTSELEKLATEHNISIGKAELINKLIKVNPLYKFEELVFLNMNDLNILLNSSMVNDVTDLEIDGSVSTGNYMSKEEIKTIVFNDANVDVNSITDLEIDLDFENNKMVYEVEFKLDSKEYEYDVDATSGAIVEKDIELDEDNDSDNEEDDDNNNVSGTYIGESRALEIALSDANLSQNSVEDIEVELDENNNLMIYEVSFEKNDTEYEYEINATTGKIIEKEID